MKHKKELLDYLRTEYVMGIATQHKRGTLWPASVYYIVDDDLSLYFMSNPKTTHAQNIKSNPRVACVIAVSDQKMSGNQIGVQISGTCKKVRGISYVGKLAKAYKKSKLKVGSLTIEAFKKAATSGIYQVKPKKLKFFNTKLYPKDKFKEFKL